MSRLTQKEGRDATLAAMPGTVKRIAEKADISYDSAAEHVRNLRASARAHVGDWGRDLTGNPVAIYFAGWGADAPKPISEYVRKSRAKAIEAAAVPVTPARYDDTVMPRAFFGGVRV